MILSKDDPDYILEEYKGYVIASHRNNVAEQSIDNLIIVYEKDDFPEYGFIVGLDDSKLFGPKRSVPNNLEDAKAYIEWVIRTRQIQENAGLGGPKEPVIREKPIIEIEGTSFWVNIYRLHLSEVANPGNIIHFTDMTDEGTGYSFLYSLESKNLALPWGEEEKVKVKIPEFVAIDPEGMAEKYKMTLKQLEGKSDFEIMVDQKAFEARVNQGVLPTIDIAGSTFYIELSQGRLRPKGDLQSKGIRFDELDHPEMEDVYGYTIPYNPRTHEFQKLDYKNITEFPKDIIVVRIPGMWALDPIGFNLQRGLDIKTKLKAKGIKLQFSAVTVPWEETFLSAIIRFNRQQKAYKERTSSVNKNSQEQKKAKGRSV